MPAEIKPNLAPESMPWARDRDQRLQDLERAAKRTAEGVDNTDSSQNATLKLLSKQVAALNETILYLASLYTVSTSDSTFSWGAGTNDASYITGPSLTLNLPEPRNVQVTYTAPVDAQALPGTGGSSLCLYRGAIALDGAPGDAVAVGTQGFGTSGTGQSATGILVISRAFVVPAGTHAISHVYKRIALAGSGSGATAYGTKSAGTLTVQITGKPQ